MHPITEQRRLAGAQETQPLSSLGVHPFQTYLDQQQLSWSAVAQEADVLCLLVWNMSHGRAVRGRHAARVRVAVTDSVAWPTLDQ